LTIKTYAFLAFNAYSHGNNKDFLEKVVNEIIEKIEPINKKLDDKLTESFTKRIKHI
jgi:hypothetical protein